MMFNRIKEDLFIYILVFLIIWISDESYLFSTSGIDALITVKWAFFAIIPFVVYVFSRKRHVIKDIKALAIPIIFLLLSALFNINSIGWGIMILTLQLVTAFIISKKIDFPRISFAFSDVMIIICVYSLLIYLFAFLLEILPTTSIVNIEGREMTMSYGSVFYSDYVLIRASAIFREPGVFMIFINLAFLLDTFFNYNKIKYSRLIICFLAILSSFSTGGIICFALILIAGFLNNREWKSAILISVLVTIGVFVIVNSEDIFLMFFKKLSDTDSGSASARLSSIAIPINVWTDSIKNFFFGCGIRNFEAEYIRAGRELYHTTIDPQGLSTNTIFNAFAIFGCGFGLFIIGGFYCFTHRVLVAGRLILFLLFLVFCLLFSNENMIYCTTLMVFIMYGLTSSKSTSKTNHSINNMKQ